MEAMFAEYRVSPISTPPTVPVMSHSSPDTPAETSPAATQRFGEGMSVDPALELHGDHMPLTGRSQWAPDSMRDGNIDPELLTQQVIPARRLASEVVDDMAPPLTPNRNFLPGPVLRTQTREKCTGLSDEQTEDTIAFTALSPQEMMIDLKIHNYRLENEFFKRYLHMYAFHPHFEVRLRHRVAGILLAPCLVAYICGLRSFVLSHIQKPENLQALKLPPSIQDDPITWKKIKEVLADVLATSRHDIARKLDLGVENQIDIYSLTASIMMYDMKVKKEHWGRVAFLRATYVKWSALPTTKVNEKGKTVKAKKISFWRHVDAELKKVRLASMANGADEKQRQANQTNFFAALLEADTQTYTQAGTESYGRVYRDGDTLTSNQRIGEDAAREFVVDDSRVLVADESEE